MDQSERAPAATSALSHGDVDERVVLVCHQLEAKSGDIADAIVSDLRQEPTYAAAMPESALTTAVRSSISGLLECVRVNEIRPLFGGRELGRSRAQQAVPLPTVLWGYRVGLMHLWTELVAACAQLDRDRADVTGAASRALLESATVLWTAFDTHAQEVGEEYRAFEAERLQQDQSHRQRLVMGLFSGETGSNLSTAEVAQRLGISPAGPYVVLATGAATVPGLRTQLSPKDGPPDIWYNGPNTDFGLVSLNTPRALTELIQRVSTLQLGRVGVSRVFRSLSQIPGAAAQARLARAAGPDGQHAVTEFDDAQMASLILAAPDIARSLQLRVLGALEQMTEAEQSVLIDTLYAWFESGGNTEAAATVLHCHPNTVRYRLNKISSSLDCNLKDPLATAYLYLAMEARRLADALIRD